VDNDFFEAMREKKKKTTTKKKKRALERRLCAYPLFVSSRHNKSALARTFMIWGIGNAFSNASFLFPQ
tara:strand:- start:175 stop:378 length:204 start_codon:yes stop_codon:yes gene_type:complete